MPLEFRVCRMTLGGEILYGIKAVLVVDGKAVAASVSFETPNARSPQTLQEILKEMLRSFRKEVIDAEKNAELAGMVKKSKKRSERILRRR